MSAPLGNLLHKKHRSLWLAAAFLLALVLWLVLGTTYQAQSEAPAPAPTEPTVMTVEARWQEAQPFSPTLTLQGQLEAWQAVELQAQTSGRVEQLLAQEGQVVRAGDPLLQLALETRPARVAQLEAELASRSAELNAAERLRDGDFLSETERLRLYSQKRQVEAELAAARLDLEHTRPTAPFSGRLENRQVELGAFVQSGQPLFWLLNLDTLKATAQVPQHQVHSLEPGYPVSLRLMDGQSLTGQLHRISHQADPATRSFRVEARIDNPEQKRLAGATARLQIQLPATTAHFISLALLTLDEQGRPSVRHLDESQRVQQTPVTLLSSQTEGAWVSGLPLRVHLITQGGGFVAPGTRVEVHPADAEPR